MKNKRLTIAISSLLLLSCIVYVFPLFINNRINNKVIVDDSINDKTNIDDSLLVSETIDYSNKPYISDKLSLIFEYNDFKPLSNEEIISHFNLSDDYYEEDNINGLLNKGFSYYESFFSSDNGSTILIKISKPNYKPTNKDLIKIYDYEYLNKISDDYSKKGYKDVLTTSSIKSFLDKDTIFIDISYKDNNDNSLYIRNIYLINNNYLGEIIISSNSIEELNNIEGYFKYYEKEKC